MQVAKSPINSFPSSSHVCVSICVSYGLRARSDHHFFGEYPPRGRAVNIIISVDLLSSSTSSSSFWFSNGHLSPASSSLIFFHAILLLLVPAASAVPNFRSVFAARFFQRRRRGLKDENFYIVISNYFCWNCTLLCKKNAKCQLNVCVRAIALK